MCNLPLRKMDISTITTFIGITCLGLLSLTNAQKIPRISITPAETQVAKFEGENYLVSCKANDNVPPTGWQDPRNVKVGTSEQNRIRTEANVGLELYFTDIKMEDAGLYTCVSRGGRSGFNLTVVRPIVFDTSLAVQSAREGRDFVLKCVARGHTANTKIVWRIDFRPPGGRFKQLPDGNLHIRQVSEADGRHKYLCRAMDVNPARPDTKDMAITLKVQMRPKLHGPPRKNAYGVVDGVANLTCQVIAEPPARFEWYLGNKRLWPSNDYIIFNQTDNHSVLQLLIKKGSDFGDYMCIATNGIGPSVNQTLSLRRAKKPRKPTLKAIHLGSTGVAVRVENPSDPGRYNDPATDGDKMTREEDLPVIGYVVQYKMMKRENWVTAHNVTFTNYGFILRSLHPNVAYLIKAASRNQASTGDYSAELHVTTPANVPFNPPLNGGNTLKPVLEYSILNVAFITLLVQL